MCVTVQVKNHLDPNFESMTYYPTIYFNEFWLLRDNLIPVNDTVEEVHISLDLSQMPMWKFTIFSQVEKSFEMQVGLSSTTADAPGIRSCDPVQQKTQAAHHACLTRAGNRLTFLVMVLFVAILSGSQVCWVLMCMMPG